MISIKIFKDGILTHGQDFKNIDLANTWIQLCENKPSHPWGRPAGWFKLVRDNTIEFMGTSKVIKPEEILETRTIENMNQSIIEVRLNSEYQIEILDLDQDPLHLKQKKQQALQTVRDNFQDKIDDTYDAMKVAILNAKEIQKLGEATQLSDAFTTMASSIDTATTALPIVKLCVKAIEKLAQTQNLSNQFKNMMLTLDPLFIWRNTTVVAIKACNSVTELEAISLIPPE